MGDLNYRVELKDNIVKSLVEKRDFEEILQADQLLRQQKEGKAFVEFKEAKINFPPSYKYDVGTNNFDSSEKRRVPSYCDRILYHSKSIDGEDDIEASNYNSWQQILSSDHKPVSCDFKLKVRSIIPSKQNDVYTSLLREFDKFENESIPDIQLSTQQLQFKDLSFMINQTKSLKLINTGKVIAQWKFINDFGQDKSQGQLNNNNNNKPWLQIIPSQGILVPGKKEKNSSNKFGLSKTGRRKNK